MVRQKILYAEISFSPSNLSRYSAPYDVYMEGLLRGRERAKRELGVQINFIYDIARSIEDPVFRMEAADYTLELAISGKGNECVALGLAGMEIGFPPEPFAHHFERARFAGLHTTAHAGELSGPDDVWSVLNSLQVDRIAHGVGSIQDPTLVSYLAKQNIPLDVCVTSNLRMGLYASITNHPICELLDEGVKITINSDDPGLFNIDLNHEYEVLATQLRVSMESIENLVLNSVRYSFLSDEPKRRLEAEFMSELKFA
jgi:aminodeoxyfutalosine deaminase